MKKASLVILGGDGMLGHKLFQRLREQFPGTVATTRGTAAVTALKAVPLLQGDDVIPDVDVMDFDGLRAHLEALAPDVVINCVGVIKQRDEARDALASIAINALLPHKLAKAAEGWGGRVIHFSTDCVFSGRRGVYTENDQSDAEDLYGRTKFLGEVAAPNAITLRTSIVGRELKNQQSLLEWLLSQRGRRVRGYKRVIYSGVTTNEMARVVARVIRDFPRLCGVYQVASEPISKFDLLGLIRDAYGLPVEIEPDEQEVSDRSMTGERFEEATGWRAPAWCRMVEEMAADTTPYEEWKGAVG